MENKYQPLQIKIDGSFIREIAINKYICEKLNYICKVEGLFNKISLVNNVYYNKKAFENAENIVIHNLEDRFIIVICRNGFKPYTLTIIKQFEENYINHLINKSSK